MNPPKEHLLWLGVSTLGRLGLIKDPNVPFSIIVAEDLHLCRLAPVHKLDCRVTLSSQNLIESDQGSRKEWSLK